MGTPGVQTTKSIDIVDVAGRHELLIHGEASDVVASLTPVAHRKSSRWSFAPTKSIRPSMSRRRIRTNAYFDELLQDEESSRLSAQRIARWGVLCGWIYFFQTFAALFVVSLPHTEGLAYTSQLAFQSVYSVTSCSFIVIYSCMETKPPLDYFIGVFLYTLGYMCFMFLYAAIVMTENAPESVSDVTSVLYLSGSLLFLFGSACLMHATLPGWFVETDLEETSLVRKMSKSVISTVRVTDQQVALFFGSIMFFSGSCCFSLDSAWGLLDTESKQQWLQNGSIAAGYFVFTLGRLYFLWGSTTKDCDVFFRRANRHLNKNITQHAATLEFD